MAYNEIMTEEIKDQKEKKVEHRKTLKASRYRSLLRSEKRERKAKRIMRELWNIYKQV